jgi:hypothetical protein
MSGKKFVEARLVHQARELPDGATLTPQSINDCRERLDAAAWRAPVEAGRRMGIPAAPAVFPVPDLTEYAGWDCKNGREPSKSFPRFRGVLAEGRRRTEPETLGEACPSAPNPRIVSTADCRGSEVAPGNRGYSGASTGQGFPFRRSFAPLGDRAECLIPLSIRVRTSGRGFAKWPTATERMASFARPRPCASGSGHRRSGSTPRSRIGEGPARAGSPASKARQALRGRRPLREAPT